MAILKYANQSGIVYAYESISEWDPVKKQSRSKRRCLGRVDPETGEIIPTSGKRGRSSNDENAKSKDDDTNIPRSADLEEKLSKLEKDYEELRQKYEILSNENNKLKAVITKIGSEISGIQ